MESRNGDGLYQRWELDRNGSIFVRNTRICEKILRNLRIDRSAERAYHITSIETTVGDVGNVVEPTSYCNGLFILVDSEPARTI